MPSIFYTNSIVLVQTMNICSLYVCTYQVLWALGSGLILLKMIAEYMDISNALPALATEIVHRVAEILKSFNSRSCQLVLGAGAMQVRCRILANAVQFICVIWWFLCFRDENEGQNFYSEPAQMIP